MAGVSYQLPAWLNRETPDFAQKFLSGVQVGASIGEARNKLAAQQQQFAVEAQQKQDQITSSALKEAQQLEVSKAYNDQQIALKQQQLEIADKKVGAETIKAGRMYQAQQQYQKDYQAALSENPDDEEGAARSAMFKNLSMFGSGAGAAGAIRSFSQRGASVPQTMDVSDIGGRQHRYIYRGPGSTMHEVGGGTEKPSFFTQRDYMGLQSELKGLQKAQSEDVLGNDPKNTAYAQRAARIQQIGSQLGQLRGGSAAESAPTAAPQPANGSRVKVKSPDGQTGTIPASQLDDAIDAGYEQVE